MELVKNIKRAIVGTVLLGAALGAGANTLPAAHAGGLPAINASVKLGSIIQVTGSKFAPGDKVLVEAFDNDTHKLAAYAYTQASYSMPLCSLNGGGCVTLPGGNISVSLPAQFVHCGYLYETVVAIDLNNGLRSNLVQVTLGYGPC